MTRKRKADEGASESVSQHEEHGAASARGNGWADLPAGPRVIASLSATGILGASLPLNEHVEGREHHTGQVDMPRESHLEPQTSAMKLLSLLDPAAQHVSLIEHYLDAGALSAVPSNTIMAAIPAIYELVNEIKAGNSADILRRLSQNGQRELKLDSCQSSSAFRKSSTGHQIRWEFMGVIFSLSGISALLYPSQTALLCPAKEHAARMIWASNACIDMSAEAGNPSLLTIWLLCENINLLSMTYGEASKHPVRGHHWHNFTTDCTQVTSHGVALVIWRARYHTLILTESCH